MPKFCHRQQTLESLRRSTIHQSLSTTSSSMALARGQSATLSDPKRAMELLRSLVQPLINDELRRVLQKYSDLYFRPALENAKKNLGEENVSDGIIGEVCKSALESAKDLFQEGKAAGVVGADRKKAAAFLKRKIGDGLLAGPPSKKKKKKRTTPLLAAGPNGRPQTDLILVSKSGKPVRREGPNWRPERLSAETLFILGSKANKALGFGQTRGRLYIKHPELFKYSGDQEDKEWLAKNQLMSTTGGKAYLMVLDDILELSQTPDYAAHPRQQPNELLGFTVPEFMVRKMRSFVEHVRTEESVPDDKLIKHGEAQIAKWEVDRKSLLGVPGTVVAEPAVVKQSEEAAAPSVVEPTLQALKVKTEEKDVDLDDVMPNDLLRSASVNDADVEKVEAILNEMKRDDMEESSVVTDEDLGTFLHNMNLNNLVREFELEAASGNSGHNPLGGFLSALAEEAGDTAFPELTNASEDVKEEDVGGANNEDVKSEPCLGCDPTPSSSGQQSSAEDLEAALDINFEKQDSPTANLS